MSEPATQRGRSPRSAPAVAATAKILLVAYVGVFGLITGIDNIVDYKTNFAVVQHVLSMDAVPRGSVFMWRAIDKPAFHRAAYWVIIFTEFLYGSLCILGSLRLFLVQRAVDRSFNSAKSLAVAGLALGFTLYFFGFLVIGGEWFQMWQAGQWNMQQGAFRFLGCIGLVLIFLCLPDPD